MSWTLAAVVIASISLIVIIFIGFMGNLLVVIVMCKKHRSIRTRGTALIASLAVADTFQSLNMVFMLISLVSFGRWIFGDLLCQVNGFLTTEFILVSILNLMVISINRYYMVVKRHDYKRVFSKRNQKLIISAVWLSPLIFAISPLVGWSEFHFQPGKCICVFYLSTSISYSVALVVVAVPVPLVVIYTSFKILKHVRQHSNRVSSLRRQSRMNIEEIHITKTLTVVIMAYLVSFTPAAIVNLVEMFKSGYEIPIWIDVLSLFLVLCNHANNPIIYSVLNRQYRLAFKETLSEILHLRQANSRPASVISTSSIPCDGLSQCCGLNKDSR